MASAWSRNPRPANTTSATGAAWEPVRLKKTSARGATNTSPGGGAEPALAFLHEPQLSWVGRARGEGAKGGEADGSERQQAQRQEERQQPCHADSSLKLVQVHAPGRRPDARTFEAR